MNSKIRRSNYTLATLLRFLRIDPLAECQSVATAKPSGTQSVHGDSTHVVCCAILGVHFNPSL